MTKFYCAFLLFFLLFCAGSSSLYAQATEPTTKFDVIPPSPEASALGRYGQIPVSLYTGVPNISIPLWNVQENTLSVPIALNYHAGGNRIGEVASRAGLGWTVGGQSVISRSVRGLQDDPYYFRTLTYIGVPPHQITTLSNEKQFAVYEGATLSKCYDLEPDEFSFNIEGRYSGTFMFNDKKEIVIASANKLTIQPTFTGAIITAWTVTVEDGTQYYFDVQETTFIKNFSRNNEFACTGNNTNSYISSWYVRKVTASNQLTALNYTYSDYTLTYQHERSESDVHLLNTGQGGGCCAHSTDRQFSYYLMETRGKQLASITSSSGQAKVEFKGTTLRTDVTGVNLYQLNEVVVTNSQGKIVRSYQLQYDYSSGRLTLKKITESSNGISKPPHQFTYNSQVLPERNAYTQDFWGYYNYNLANTLLVPVIYYNDTGLQYLEGADRSCDATRMQAAILQKIQYPTGGTTIFTFEPHTYSYEEDTRLTDKAQKEYKKVLMSPQVAVEGAGTNLPIIRSKPLDVISQNQIPVPVKVEAMIDATASGGFRGCTPRVYITNSAGQKVFEKFINGSGSTGTVTQSFVEHIFLAPGSYTMYAQAMCTFENLRDYAEIGATWENYSEVLVTEKMAGGLRLKKMVDFDGLDHSRDQVKTYEYSIVDQGKTLSSGSLIDISNVFISGAITEPTNVFAFDTERSSKANGGSCFYNGLTCQFFNRVATSAQARATQGSPVGYRQVTVYTGPVEQQGKTVYHYSSPYTVKDVPAPSGYPTAFPFAPAASMDNRRGLLLDQEVYRFKAGNWNLIQKDTITYGFGEFTVAGVKIGLHRAGVDVITDAELGRFRKVNYSLSLGYSQKLATKTHRYDETGKRLTESSTFGYSPLHRQLTYSTKQQSDGTQVVTKLSYALDYDIPTASGVAAQAIKAMQSKHIISSPIEKQVWVKRSASDSSLVSAHLTTYRQLPTDDIVLDTQFMLNHAAPLTLSTTSNSTATTFMPARISSGVFSYDTKYQPRLQYGKYDAKSNLQQVQESNGVPVSFIWGYNGSYPIAQVKNADWTAITTALGQIGTTESAVEALTDAAIIRDKMEQLRLKLPKAQLTCYTYDPLLGMSSATDMNNQTSFYEYDGLGRLADVKDFNGDIVQDYQYHYKGQPEEKYVPKTSIIPVLTTNTAYTNQLEFSGDKMLGPHVYYTYKDQTYNKLYLIGKHIQVIDFNTLTDGKPTSRLYTDLWFTKVQKLENQIHIQGNKLYIGTHVDGLYVIHRQTGESEKIDLLAGTGVVHDNTKINSVVIDNASNRLYAPVIYRSGATEIFYGLVELNLTTNAKRWITTAASSSPVKLPNFTYADYWNGYKVDLDIASNTLYLSGSFGLWWWNRTTNATGVYNRDNGGIPLAAGNPQLPDNRVTMSFIDQTENKFYMGTPSGLLVWNRKDNTSQLYSTTTPGCKLIDNTINHITKYEELSLLFVATENGGLWTLNTLTGEQKLYTQDVGNETDPQLMDSGIESAYFDPIDKKLYATGWLSNGGVWIRDYKTMLSLSQPVDAAQDQNWVTTTAVLSAGVKTRGQISNLSAFHRSQSIAYLDGLGRPIQQVQTSGSPLLKDVVQPLAYDAFGREPFKYLPYIAESMNGRYQPDALLSATTGKAIDFYKADRPMVSMDGRVSDAAPFAETVFETSPLNRVIEQGAPGTSWQIAGGKTTKVLERTNLDDEVLQWDYTFASTDIFGTCQADYYPLGELYVSQTTDEHGNQTREYQDKNGRVVCKKVQFQGSTTPLNADFLTTCYVYDDLGQLRMVIQPEGVAKIGTLPFTATDTDNFISNWCYTYHYDARGRMVEKKVPGSEPVRMVYNLRNEVVLTQDGAQRLRKEWSFTKYDALGRTILTGIYANDQQTDRVVMQTLVNSFTGINLYEEAIAATPTNHGYTNRAFPVGGVGNASAWVPSFGKHSLSVTPYSAADATGTKGATTAISFNVVQTGTYTDNTLPSLSISAPLANSTLNAGSNVVVTASVTDADGIAKVEFFYSIAGGIAQKLGESTTPFSGSSYKHTWNTPPGGTYLLTVKATDTKGGVSTQMIPNVTVGGSILREVWSNLPGTAVADANLVSGNQPTSSTQLALLESPTDEDEYYGSRIRGYLSPTKTGSYTFWIAGDDNCELYLSTTSNPTNKAKIAYVTSSNDTTRYTKSQEWNKYPSQKSGSISLTAGNSYYIEVIHKENDRGDNVAVGWMPPNTSTTTVIPGIVLRPFAPNLLPIANAGVDQTLQGSSLTLIGSGVDLDGNISTYGWQQRSGPIIATLSGANTASLTASNLTVGTYLFRLTVTDNAGVSEYDEVVLKVEPAPTQSVSSLKLVDADTGTELMTIANNSTIVLGNYVGKKLNIKAITSPATVGSVQFNLDSSPATSNVAPYLLRKASPASDYQVYGASYYDTYDFDRDNAVDAYGASTPTNKERYRTDFQGEFTALVNEPLPAPFIRVVDKVTGSKVRVLNTAGKVADPAQWLWSSCFYDERGRAVQTQADNHLGGLDVSTLQYHFSGRVVKSFLKHMNTNLKPDSLTIKQRSVYDHASRITEVYQQINKEAEEPISKNNYNELSQLISKKVGTDGTKELQTIDYRYNIRGWLTLINDAALSTPGDLFGMRLLYEDAPTDNKQYNGNIGSMQWMSNFDRKGRNFKYRYDAANRLVEAAWATPSSSTGDFSVNGISYDKNGNILTLNQSGLSARKDNASPLFEAIDRLRYSYQGNRLSSVEDGITNQGLAGDFQDGNKQALNPIAEYNYDSNGNLSEDKNKGIAGIIYNQRNLPGTILMDNSGANRIEYVYTAGGAKLRKEVYQGGSLLTTTDYVGGLVFENKELQFVPTTEGRALTGKLAGTAGFAFEYHYKDHLGNLRMAFRKSKTLRTYTATMELNNPREAEFANVTRDGTYKQTGSYSALLSTTNVLGPWKTIKVSRGDRVEAKVFAHYDGDAATTGGVSLQVYLGKAGLTGGSGESGNNLPLLKNVGLGLSIVPNPSTTTLPKAYLKYIFYDQEGNFVSSSYKPVTTAAKGTQNNQIWQEIKFSDANTVKDAFWADQNGTVQVMVVNESNVPVWFDNLEIGHQEAMIVQENHYGPLGLNLVGIETQGQPDHKFQYNGKEKQTELGLNLIDYGARMYDAALGRFHTQDRFAEKYYGFSPYQYAANNPIKNIDVNGDSILIAYGKDLINYHSNGQLYWSNTQKLYDGKGVVKKGKKAGQLKGFLKQSVDGLNQIKGGGSAGNELITDLASKKENVVIKSTDGATVTNGGTISWNSTELKGGMDVNGKSTRPAYIGLAHELSHTWATINGGDRSREPWVTFSNGEDRTKSEWFATHMENRIRAENGVPLREYYSVDSREGALLAPGTNYSLFFFHIREFEAGGMETIIKIPYDYIKDRNGGMGSEEK